MNHHIITFTIYPVALFIQVIRNEVHADQRGYALFLHGDAVEAVR